MTVDELREALEGLPGDMEVIAATDDEGNDYDFAYPPRVTWCIADTGFRCGYYAVDEGDVEAGEYEGETLVRMAVM